MGASRYVTIKILIPPLFHAALWLGHYRKRLYTMHRDKGCRKELGGKRTEGVSVWRKQEHLTNPMENPPKKWRKKKPRSFDFACASKRLFPLRFGTAFEFTAFDHNKWNHLIMTRGAAFSSYSLICHMNVCRKRPTIVAWGCGPRGRKAHSERERACRHNAWWGKILFNFFFLYSATCGSERTRLP